MAYSEAKLKNSGVKASPCFNFSLILLKSTLRNVLTSPQFSSPSPRLEVFLTVGYIKIFQGFKCLNPFLCMTDLYKFHIKVYLVYWSSRVKRALDEIRLQIYMPNSLFFLFVRNYWFDKERKSSVFVTVPPN